MKIIGNKRNMISIWIKFDMYEVFISYIIYCLLFYFMTILITFFPARFMVSLSLMKGISESIGQNYFSRKSTRKQMDGGGGS